MNKEILNQLDLLNKQGQEILKRYYDPHCQIIINSQGIRIVRDEIFSPTNNAIEILDEENDEFEDIEEIETFSDTNFYNWFSLDEAIRSINKLIRNQKKIIERLKSNE